ncbi:hemerythrin [Desulfolithobacter dissulfuricans]|uniref:Hemerythrin n=1 Tax=Desulfolithobacter dissulfuricans TaxID=2795293 RepID=A0A915XIT8_9BACT|nr:hemerythrin family protein [Desulfolithobacter dissulfuricans]BCO09520.1 hemerythrin [Desulfolithobacter dissulfuricans]
MNNILYIVWSDNNNIGIPIIDEQHRGIISTINSLHYFIQTGHGDEIIKPTMIILEQYVDIHFKTEEALMKKANYPDIKDHIVMHKKLVEKTKNLSIYASSNNDSNIILKFLKEWWLGHINKEDVKYAPFLKKLLDSKSF